MMTQEHLSQAGQTAKELANLTEKGICLTDVATFKKVSVPSASGTDLPKELHFSFEFMGCLFAARAEADETGCRVRIHANLGHLPYSSESRNLRTNIGAIILAANSALDGRMQLTREQRILLFNDVHLNEPLTPTMFMTRTVRFLVKAKPFLELIVPLIESPTKH